MEGTLESYLEPFKELEKISLKYKKERFVVKAYNNMKNYMAVRKARKQMRKNRYKSSKSFSDKIQNINYVIRDIARYHSLDIMKAGAVIITVGVMGYKLNQDFFSDVKKQKYGYDVYTEDMNNNGVPDEYIVVDDKKVFIEVDNKPIGEYFK